MWTADAADDDRDDDGDGKDDDGGGSNDDGGGNNDDDDEEDDRGRVTHTVDQPTGQGRWKPRLWTELSSNLVHLVRICIMWRLYNICTGIDTYYYDSKLH